MTGPGRLLADRFAADRSGSELRSGVSIAGLTAVAEEERIRLVRHIHDAPLQTLTAVIRRLEAGPATPADIQALRETAQNLRDLAIELSPPVLDDLGLGPALANLVDRMAERGPIPVELQRPGLVGRILRGRLPRHIELTLYRIVQEALTNAESHSGASMILVSARLSPAAATIRVVDDGIGCDDDSLRDAQARGHLGVPLMRRGATEIGALLEVARMRPHGTRVVLSWARP